VDGSRLSLECASLPSAALALFAAGVALLGSHSLNNIVGVTLAVILLSFVPEMVRRKYL
jgi:hypothetical protein